MASFIKKIKDKIKGATSENLFQRVKYIKAESRRDLVQKSSTEQTFRKLNEQDVEDVIRNAKYSQGLREVFDEHFIGLNTATSVTMGVDFDHFNKKDTRVNLVYQILRSYGFEVARFDQKEKAHPNQIMITKSGLILPFTTPQEALKMTADIYDILRDSGFNMTGFALPRSRESLTLSTIYGSEDVYTKQARGLINVVQEIDDNKIGQEILKKRNKTVEQFLREQLDETMKMDGVDVNKITEDNFKNGTQHVYRGATLGDNPYAVVSSILPKGTAYASPSMKIAEEYATGLEAGYEPVNLSNGEQVRYGFVYEFEATKDQKYYPNLGIEQRAKTKQHHYETPVFKHKNPCSAIYIKVVPGKIVKIFDNGKWISDKWRDFAMLHRVRMRSGTQVQKDYNDAQLKNVIHRKLFHYIPKHSHVSVLNLSQDVDLDLSDVNLNAYKDVILPKKIKSVCGAKFPKLKNLDLSGVSDHRFQGTDLSQIDHLILPKIITNIEGAKFPKSIEEIDLTACENMNWENVDLSSFKKIKFSKNIEGFEKAKWPEKVDCVDLSSCTNMDFSKVKLPEASEILLPTVTDTSLYTDEMIERLAKEDGILKCSLLMQARLKMDERYSQMKTKIWKEDREKELQKWQNIAPVKENVIVNNLVEEASDLKKLAEFDRQLTEEINKWAKNGWDVQPVKFEAVHEDGLGFKSYAHDAEHPIKLHDTASQDDDKRVEVIGMPQWYKKHMKEGKTVEELHQYAEKLFDEFKEIDLNVIQPMRKQRKMVKVPMIKSERTR